MQSQYYVVFAVIFFAVALLAWSIVKPMNQESRALYKRMREVYEDFKYRAVRALIFTAWTVGLIGFIYELFFA